jgi:hypothetical protein
MAVFPRSLIELRRRLPMEEACGAYPVAVDHVSPAGRRATFGAERSHADQRRIEPAD